MAPKRLIQQRENNLNNMQKFQMAARRGVAWRDCGGGGGGGGAKKWLIRLWLRDADYKRYTSTHELSWAERTKRQFLSQSSITWSIFVRTSLQHDTMDAALPPSHPPDSPDSPDTI